MKTQDTPQQHTFDVLIAGAGMVGAAVASALGQAGMRVALCDHTPCPKLDCTSPPDIRVSALSHSSCMMLQQLGAWQQIPENRRCPYRQMAVWETLNRPFSQRPIMHRFNRVTLDSQEIDKAQLGFIVENRLIQAALHKTLDSLPQVTRFCPTKIVHMPMNGSVRSFQLSDGSLLSAPLLIGADGARSSVRQQAGIQNDEHQYRQKALVATVRIAGGQQAITWQAFTPDGPRAFLPLCDHNGESWASLVWYDQYQRIDHLLTLNTKDFKAALQDAYPDELPIIHEVYAKSSFTLTRNHAKQYAIPGVVLAGDAAHTINPLAGQGVNLGFQDMAWLAQLVVEAWREKRDWSALALLKRYEGLRRPENARMQKLMDCFYYGFSSHSVWLKYARNAALAFAKQCPIGQKQMIRYAAGLVGNRPKLGRQVAL